MCLVCIDLYMIQFIKNETYSRLLLNIATVWAQLAYCLSALMYRIYYKTNNWY